MFKKIICAVVVSTAATAYSQENMSVIVAGDVGARKVASQPLSGVAVKRLVTPVAERYFSQTDGMSLDEIVRLAVANNGEIKIARLEIDKARARLTQAGSRQNPTLEVEQSTGRLVGSPGDRNLSLSRNIVRTDRNLAQTEFNIAPRVPVNNVTARVEDGDDDDDDDTTAGTPEMETTNMNGRDIILVPSAPRQTSVPVQKGKVQKIVDSRPVFPPVVITPETDPAKKKRERIVQIPQ